MNVRVAILYVFFVVCFFVPSTAHAYLDPGTGNALIYVFLSLLGAVFYFVKGFFYKLIKIRAGKTEDTFNIDSRQNSENRS